MMSKLSVIILTKNEENNILDCLESMVFADEIIVVDDYSEDRTEEVVKNLKNDEIKFYKRKLDNDFSAQRNFGLSKAKNDWVLFLDADERVSTSLREEIKDLRSKIKDLRSKNLLLVKPTTFMNNSGFAVSKVLNYYKIDPVELTVIHDDLDLPFGKIRVRFGGSAGGHHGVESIINVLKTDKFLRIRLGIGSETKNQKPRTKNQNHIERYVLGNIASSERGKVKTMIKEAIRTINLILKHGIDSYMSKYNQ